MEPQEKAQGIMTWRLVARRFFLPLAVAVGLIDIVLFVILRPLVPAGDGLIEFLLAGIFLPVALIGVGLLFFGLPLGLLVARLRLGLVESLALLVAFGFGGGAGLAAVLSGFWLDGGAILLAGLPGAVTAAAWTFINHDLFRRHDGA